LAWGGILTAKAMAPERLPTMMRNRDDEDQVMINTVDDVIPKAHDPFAPRSTRLRSAMRVLQQVIACASKRPEKPLTIAGPPILDIASYFEDLCSSDGMKLCSHLPKPRA